MWFNGIDFLYDFYMSLLVFTVFHLFLRSNFNTREFNSRENHRFFCHNSESSGAFLTKIGENKIQVKNLGKNMNFNNRGLLTAGRGYTLR